MPSDNLPYLFTAYAITWVVFFVYAFFLSRHQRELEREIQELRRAMAAREDEGEP